MRVARSRAQAPQIPGAGRESSSVKITVGKVVAVVVILAMVWGLRECDKQGWFGNPMDKVPSVDFNK